MMNWTMKIATLTTVVGIVSLLPNKSHFGFCQAQVVRGSSRSSSVDGTATTTSSSSLSVVLKDENEKQQRQPQQTNTSKGREDNNNEMMLSMFFQRLDRIETSLKELQTKWNEQDAKLNSLLLESKEEEELSTRRYLAVDTSCDLVYDPIENACMIQHENVVIPAGNLKIESGSLQVKHGGESEFHGNVAFYKNTTFHPNHNPSVGTVTTFETPVMLLHDVTIQGPPAPEEEEEEKSKGKRKKTSSDDDEEEEEEDIATNFIVKDSVHVKFEQEETFIVNSESKFHKNVHIALEDDEDDDSKSSTSSTSSDEEDPPTEPDLFVGGNIEANGVIASLVE